MSVCVFSFQHVKGNITFSIPTPETLYAQERARVINDQLKLREGTFGAMDVYFQQLSSFDVCTTCRLACLTH
jgi:hypothetical protein